ncbi:hypothetical protein [Kitasatospora griseola]|uniref:hypothetical protein n=1 Tax=Kitasatospora griseola TaxID=2064 RepID=UPI001670FF64|nr:hypothetical protein [Kitasatospora griseola]GGR05727.1 hypothetical protein GCM10010195_71300 [Kitasatospora griseola]
MATPAHARTLIPEMWKAARSRHIDSPDWPGTTPPGACRLTPADYRTLLAIRTTGTTVTLHPDHARITGPCGAIAVTWNGTAHTRHTIGNTPVALPYPSPVPDDPSAGRTGVAVFTRGDRTATGWGGVYNALA